MTSDLPTPYADVNDALELLLDGVHDVLGERFVGLYLYGSLASGDFEPMTSDIDFVVVAADELPEDIIPQLEALHIRLWDMGLKWAKKLEGSYITQRSLRRYAPTDGPWPQVNEGKFYVARHESDWIIQRHILREHGVVIAGPLLREMIDPV